MTPRPLLSAVLLALMFAAGPASSRAQTVEKPEPFDSAGRVVAITPLLAAQLELGPPAWRITGAYDEARLYAISDTAYVIVVTRSAGVVERYPLTAAERRSLRARTATLPPGVTAQIGKGLSDAGRTAVERAASNTFVRDQTLLGLVVYAPAFSRAITNDVAGQVAAYVLAAGAAFFTAAEMGREVGITPATNGLATSAGVSGALIGLGTMYGLGAGDQGRAAGALGGGIAGTALAVTLGRDVTAGQSAAARLGALAVPVTAAGVVVASRGGWDAHRLSRSDATTLAASAAGGFFLGAAYPRVVAYNVTPGDVGVLATTGALGVLGASTLIANGSPPDRTIAGALTAGWVAGLAAGDLAVVRRLDVGEGEASLIALGTGTGALMMAGIAALADRHGVHPALVPGAATVGAVAGLAYTSRYVSPRYDAGRLAARVHLDLGSLALAAGKVPGVHPVLTVHL